MSDCAICLGPITETCEATLLPCTHKFHAECVQTWCQERGTCPLCRQSCDLGAVERGEAQQQAERQEPAPAAAQLVIMEQRPSARVRASLFALLLVMFLLLSQQDRGYTALDGFPYLFLLLVVFCALIRRD